MICKLFIFRHAETYDNSNGIFSGWRDSELTPKGVVQAQEIARQLRHCKIDCAFTSHLKRARQTLKIVLETHPPIPIFVDDRLIERCYGLLQGRSKKRVADENPEFYAQFHRGYYAAPSEGESLEMVEKRVMAFFGQFREWLKQHPGNVAISCHSNSIRPIRRVFEKLSLTHMCKLESPQDRALIYDLDLGNSGLQHPKQKAFTAVWEGVLVAKQMKLATNLLNPLKRYY
jgi:2,3-bisphosphoglycerate-dependent phosphoglycerate mutase